MEMTWSLALKSRLDAHSARVGVIGLGYVGLPLAVAFAQCGFHVTGFDVSAEKVKSLCDGKSYITDIPSEILAPLVENGSFEATLDFSKLAEMDAVSIAVPTPLRKTRTPDLSYIVDAVNSVVQFLRPGQLIVLESTTYPGTTIEVVQPALEASGLKVGKDFALAFSPERIDPGNAHFGLNNTPKVVGGVTPMCTELCSALYGAITKVVPVSSPTAAEMVKLLENTFRAVNIGLVNEFALIAAKLNLDVWELIEAASTKPFGFMPFYPGPGLGGHCLPIDPHYLSWKLRTLNYRTRFIELADDINTAMPRYVADRVAYALNLDSKAVRGSRVLCLGVAYKANITDWRESPALPLIEDLQARGALVDYQDNFVPKIHLSNGEYMESIPYEPENFGDYDCIVMVTAHKYFESKDFSLARRIVDSRNALRDVDRSKVVSF